MPNAHCSLTLISERITQFISIQVTFLRFYMTNYLLLVKKGKSQLSSSSYRKAIANSNGRFPIQLTFGGHPTRMLPIFFFFFSFSAFHSGLYSFQWLIIIRILKVEFKWSIWCLQHVLCNIFVSIIFKRREKKRKRKWMAWIHVFGRQ